MLLSLKVLLSSLNSPGHKFNNYRFIEQSSGLLIAEEFVEF